MSAERADILWRTVELLAYSYYASKGYTVLVSMVESPAYDLVAEKEGVFTRINVKVAGLKDKKQKNSWSISVASGPSITKTKAKDVVKAKGEIDRYLVWLPDKKGFIELPGDFFKGSGSKSKRIPRELMENVERIEI